MFWRSTDSLPLTIYLISKNNADTTLSELRCSWSWNWYHEFSRVPYLLDCELLTTSWGNINNSQRNSTDVEKFLTLTAKFMAINNLRCGQQLFSRPLIPTVLCSFRDFWLFIWFGLYDQIFPIFKFGHWRWAVFWDCYSCRCSRYNTVPL